MSDVNSSMLIPVRMLTQYVYCNRLAYLEWVQGEFEHNTEVVEGKYIHKTVDKKSETKPKQDKDEEKLHARSVTMSDRKLGLISKMDLLEVKGDIATPIEYKRGSVPKDGIIHKDHMVQLCAQGLILRANGYICTRGMVYYATSKQRVEVIFDDITVAVTLQAIYDMKEMSKIDKIPPPLIDSPKCHRCSLVGICLPDETNALGENKIHIRKDQVRRMYPVRKDTIPVYVQEQGAYVAKSGD
ncbi:MAG: CRISPR-associated protein Cas4, partial [Thaumarchaeota archaeon]|nr:CRISPR-associated protein Cas4 [Nitrososphaerota archaeon]